MDLMITQEQIEELPENPRERFVQIEQICRQRFQNLISNEDTWGLVQDARLRYMTAVVSAAKYLKIEPVCDIAIPRRNDWDDNAFDDFVNDVSFYTMQLMLEGADRKLRTAIFLEGSTKERLRTLTLHLREEVRKLDLTPAQIDKLINKIDAFESSLEARRLTFVAVALVTLAIAGAISDVGGAATTVRELVSKIEETVGLAKEEQDKDAAAYLLEGQEVRQLMPPRTKVEGYSGGAVDGYNPSSAADPDDEIPF